MPLISITSAARALSHQFDSPSSSPSVVHPPTSLELKLGSSPSCIAATAASSASSATTDHLGGSLGSSVESDRCLPLSHSSSYTSSGEDDNMSSSSPPESTISMLDDPADSNPPC
jgi:hypothetical protein